MIEHVNYCGVDYYIAHTEEEYKKACDVDYNGSCSNDDEDGKWYEDHGTFHGFQATFFYKDYNQRCIVVLVPEGHAIGCTLKEQVLNLCKKHNIEYERIRYYKQSPYQKARYAPEYVGEEVWLKVNGFNYCFNSIDHCDPLGYIDDFFESVIETKK